MSRLPSPGPCIAPSLCPQDTAVTSLASPLSLQVLSRIPSSPIKPSAFSTPLPKRSCLLLQLPSFPGQRLDFSPCLPRLPDALPLRPSPSADKQNHLNMGATPSFSRHLQSKFLSSTAGPAAPSHVNLLTPRSSLCCPLYPPGRRLRVFRHWAQMTPKATFRINCGTQCVKTLFASVQISPRNKVM